MAKIKWTGMEEYELKLSRLAAKSEETAKKAVYEGAKVMADAMKTAIHSIPIDERHAGPGEMLSGITRKQKAGLIDGFGISPMQNDGGYINVKLGFDGYNDVVTRTHEQGQPNSLIARSVNAGTSFRKAYPFIDRTISSNKTAAEKAIQETIDEEIEKIMK